MSSNSWWIETSAHKRIEQHFVSDQLWLEMAFSWLEGLVLAPKLKDFCQTIDHIRHLNHRKYFIFTGCFTTPQKHADLLCILFDFVPSIQAHTHTAVPHPEKNTILHGIKFQGIWTHATHRPIGSNEIFHRIMSVKQSCKRKCQRTFFVRCQCFVSLSIPRVCRDGWAPYPIQLPISFLFMFMYEKCGYSFGHIFRLLFAKLILLWICFVRSVHGSFSSVCQTVQVKNFSLLWLLDLVFSDQWFHFASFK